MSPQEAHTHKDARVTDWDADMIATHMVDKLVARLSDEETVQSILAVWTGQLDQHIGKTIRRGVWVFLCAVGVIVTIKLDALIDWFRN